MLSALAREYSRAASGNQMEGDFDFVEILVQDVEGFVKDWIKTIISRMKQ
jgi:hypothetical protein